MDPAVFKNFLLSTSAAAGLLNATTNAPLASPNLNLPDADGIGTYANALPVNAAVQMTGKPYSHIQKPFYLNVSAGTNGTTVPFLTGGIISSEQSANNPTRADVWVHMGDTNWGEARIPGIINLSPEDPRYQACLSEAEKLKAEYPLDRLDPVRNKMEISKREQAIVTMLIDIIHKQYGEYNMDSIDQTNAASLHNDVERATQAGLGKGSPPALSEFKSDELVCREFAPLAARMYDAAGIPNFLVGGPFELFDVMQDGQINVTENGGHAYVVSRRTGNVIDATLDGSAAYSINISGTSISDFLAGKPIVTASAKADNDPRLSLDSGAVFSTGIPDSAIGALLTEHPQLLSSVHDANTVKAIASYYQDVAQNAVDRITPAIAGFNAAIAKNDPAVLAEACKTLNTLVPSSDFINGALYNAARASIKQQNLPMAEALMDQGAFSAWAPRFQASIAFYDLADTGKPIDPAFLRGITAKFGATPQELKEMAYASGITKQFDAAMAAGQTTNVPPHLNADAAGIAQKIGTNLVNNIGSLPPVTPPGSFITASTNTPAMQPKANTIQHK